MEGDVLERELEFHRQVAKEALRKLAPVPDYIVQRYARARHWRVFPKERMFRELRAEVHTANREIVVGEFGCGDGINSCELVRAIDGIRMESFDISPEMIEVARQRAAINGVTDRIHFFIADAERDPMRGKQVDVMLALSILHHVDIERVVPSLISSTRPGGMLVFNEPVTFSSVLQRLRNKVPVAKEVSPDERQLDRSEIDYLLSRLENPKIHYYWMFGRLIRLVPHANEIDKGHPIARFAVLTLSWIDLALLTLFPFLKKFSGRVYVTGRRPLG